MYATQPNVLLVHPSVPAKNLTEFIALLKANPNNYAFGSAGNGTSQHISGELFKVMAGVSMQHIPYRGSGQMMPELLGGTLPVAFDNIATAVQHVNAGKLRALAVTSATRSIVSPDVPTMAEAGLTGYDISSWQAVFAPDFARLLGEHVALVFASLAAATALGVPLGLAAAKVRGLAQPVLALTGLVQTIPALALLAFLIPLTGSIGVWPAMIALFLYALLPITRNAHAGLVQVPAGLVQAGVALGLERRQVLASIELPLAMRTILAGVKTSAVINVGTATIAAFIGAGGFGERIVQGLALNDHTVLLAGALPAAGLALVVHALFELAERWMVRAPR
jgi:osmoprotectant transport system permease protein